MTALDKINNVWGFLAGGGGKEANLPATVKAAKPVLKTGGATGPLPPPIAFTLLALLSFRRPATVLDAGKFAPFDFRAPMASLAGP